jgi:predicted nucleic acid-binding protein
MTAEVFLDTNILLYACSAATDDRAKKAKAEELVLNSRFALSAQVLQEFVANALKKKALGLSESNIDATLEMARHVRVLPLSLPLIVKAVELRRGHQISHWDATILAAAQELGCSVLYSEDFSHGRRYGDVLVTNPFREQE